MKILVLAPPMGGTGGIQNYTAALARALGEINGTENVRMVAVPAEPTARADGNAALGSITKIRFLLNAIAAAIFWRPQLVICTHLGVSEVARIIHRITGAPYWVILHGIEVWCELALSKVEALRGAQQLVVNSKFTLEAANARHGLEKCKSVFLPPTYLADDSPESKKSANVVESANTPTVLTVGRLAASERYKGHDVMLDAWAAVLREIPQARYIIVGDGDDRARLQERGREMGFASSVIFKGGVSSAELQSCYDECQVFALPARTELDPRAPRGEGFGIVFLEAMAHGKPVVGPNVGAPPEFIHDGEHGLLVDPVNAAKLAQALVELLANPERARQMGEAGRNWAREQYGYEMFRERLRKILQTH
ncbi:MAG TPA: glycosyltransferase family 4 protein [Candidatus Acidoferrales bacterium]